MSVDAPKIDSRDQLKLVEQIQNLALKYCPQECFPDAWGDLSSIKADKQANALIHIFARMMEIIISKLNKVPDQNFLAFLDMVGVRPFPPKVARSPLTFTMTNGASQYVSIPAGTQVATEETEGQEAVVFETEKTLTVIAPKLVKAVSISPENDMWTDHSAVLVDREESGSEELFKGKDLIPHRLYLGHSKLFGFKEETAITLETEIEEISTDFQGSDEWAVKWYYFDEKSVPRPLDIEIAKSPDSPSNITIDQKVANLLKSGSITFKPVAEISEKELTGIEKETDRNNSWMNNWLFAELSTPIPKENSTENLPKISSIKAHVIIDCNSPVIPDLAFFNNIPLDLSKDFYPFGERPKFNDTFYIGSKEVFSKKGAKITIGITLSEGVEAPVCENIKLLWESWNGSGWEVIGEATKDDESKAKYNFVDKTKAFTLKGEEKSINFTCPNIEEKEINGDNNRWIRVRIIDGNYGSEARYEESPTFKGTGKIRTENNNVLYGKGTAFNREINIGDSIIIINNTSQTRIVTSIISDDRLVVNSPISDFNTETEFYIKKIGWTYIPSTYKPPSISKLTLKYIFSSEDRPEVILTYNDFVYQNYSDSTQITQFQRLEDTKPALYFAFDKNISTMPVTIFFPLIGRTISTKKTPIQLIGKGTISSNNTTITGTGTNFSKILRVGDSIAATGQERKVISISTENSLTVDLPFNPALQAGTNFSYIHSEGEFQDNPFLTWQYWTGKEWLKLKVEDYTDNLTKRELIQFLAPVDIAKKYCFSFESDYYWIRAVLEKGMYENFPSLKAIYTNTVWAHNVIKVKDEILGFSNGKSNQTFKFSRFSILSGQKVLVRELSLSEEDKKTIISEEGEDAIEEITDNAGNIAGFWIRWHEMKNFYFSKPNSRHYVADLSNGTITFGNGERGMIPPAGKDNIKCSYLSGGGAKGNVQAGTITKLRTTFPYIDSVTNHEAAEGGGDKEDLDRVRERGPQTLKHRDRAVTYEDFEWLVREASPNVAKVKCLPTRDPSLRIKPGWITLIIVPENDDPKPLPTQQLVSEVETYLFERTSSYLTTYPSQVSLIGPGYIQVWVEATVQFASITEAKIIEGKILDKLQHFFHPLHGGPEKKGWDFGRNVYISEVYELIENIEGVDYVDDIYLKAAIHEYKLELNGSIKLSVYPKNSKVYFNERELVLFLAETLQGNIDELHVVGFKEGDQIIISDSNGNISTLSVKSVLDNKLECETDLAISVLVDSIVETPNGIRSYTTADSEQNDQNNILLTIATPDEKSWDTVVLEHRDNPAVKEPLLIKNITKIVDTIFIDENYLVYSGPHTIN